MGDLRKRVIFVKCWILEEKMRDFRLNVGFSKRKGVIFGLNGGFAKRKREIFGLNGRFLKRKCVFFA